MSNIVGQSNVSSDVSSNVASNAQSGNTNQQGFTPQAPRDERVMMASGAPGLDPFARPGSVPQGPSVPAATVNGPQSTFAARHYNPNLSPDLGEVSDIPDTADAERAAIQGMIPSEAPGGGGLDELIGAMRTLAETSNQKSAQAASAQSPALLNVTPEEEAAVNAYRMRELKQRAALARGGFPAAQSPAVSQTNRPAPGLTGTPGLTGEQSDPQVPDDLTQYSQAHASASQSEVTKAKKDQLIEVPDEVTFTDAEILPILDAILIQGYAEDSFNIRNCRVTFRTQFFWEDNVATRLVEDKLLKRGNAFRGTADVVLQTYFLATNLKEFGGTAFPVLRTGTPEELEKSINDRVEFLNRLPTGIVLYLWQRRFKFMQKVNFAMNNFERLIKVF